jgi:hypothetical protein
VLSRHGAISFAITMRDNSIKYAVVSVTCPGGNAEALFVTALVKQVYDAHFLGSNQFAAFITSETARWSAVANAAGLLSKS